MPDFLSSHWLTAFAIFFLSCAVLSAPFGMVLAQRVGKSWWQGLIPAFFLPWIGLLLIPRPPAKERYTTGFAHYATIMLYIASGMVTISVFMVWVSGQASISGRMTPFSFTPTAVFPLALVVILVALSMFCGATGIQFSQGLSAAIPTAVVVSALGGLILAAVYLSGLAGLFLDAGKASGSGLDAEVGKGAWLALVALCTGYFALFVAPFGLKVRSAEVASVPPSVTPPPPTLSQQNQPPIPPAPQTWSGPRRNQGATW